MTVGMENMSPKDLQKKSHANSVVLKNYIKNSGKNIVSQVSVLGKKKVRKLYFFQTILRSTLSRNVNSQNSMLALRKPSYSAQDVSFTLPKSTENARKITRFHMFRI